MAKKDIYPNFRVKIFLTWPRDVARSSNEELILVVRNS